MLFIAKNGFLNDISVSDLILIFFLDYVFDHSVTTSHIYNILGKPLVDKAMEGFNGKI